MANLVKERIALNLDRVKSQGHLRTEHIREIVQEAVMLTVAELKDGSDEIREIVQDAIAIVIKESKGNSREKPAKITAAIEGAISGSTYHRQQEIVERRSRLMAIQVQLDAQQEQLDQASQAILLDIKDVELTDDNSEAINLAVDAYQEHQEMGFLREHYLNLQTQLTALDDTLIFHYGDRYSDIKQQWERAKTWYEQKKVEADSSGVTPLQTKQVEIETIASNFGVAVVRTENELKQKIKNAWHQKASFTKE